MKITIVGLGEVGRCYASAFAKNTSAQLFFCDPYVSTAAGKLSCELDVPINESIGDWLKGSDYVLSCVVGTKSLEVARECLIYLKPNAVFADLTTAAPEQKRTAGAEAAKSGVGYVDVAIMGAIAFLREKTPLLCSGSQAGAFVQILESGGVVATALPKSHPGDAITLKILRSVIGG